MFVTPPPTLWCHAWQISHQFIGGGWWGQVPPGRGCVPQEGFHTAQCVAVAGDSVALQLDGDAIGAAVRAGHVVRAAADAVPFPDVVLVGLRFQVRHWVALAWILDAHPSPSMKVFARLRQGV